MSKEVYTLYPIQVISSREIICRAKKKIEASLVSPGVVYLTGGLHGKECESFSVPFRCTPDEVRVGNRGCHFPPQIMKEISFYRNGIFRSNPLFRHILKQAAWCI